MKERKKKKFGKYVYKLKKTNTTKKLSKKIYFFGKNLKIFF